MTDDIVTGHCREFGEDRECRFRESGLPYTPTCGKVARFVCTGPELASVRYPWNDMRNRVR